MLEMFLFKEICFLKLHTVVGNNEETIIYIRLGMYNTTIILQVFTF